MSTKPFIDFCIHSDPYKIKVTDFSNWNIIENKPSIIDITLPGFSDSITKYFDKGKVTSYNSLSLDANCSEDPSNVEPTTLTDGVYTIKVTGSPSTFSKEVYYLKTDLHQLELDRIYIDSIEKDCYEKVKDKLTEAEYLVRAAEAYLRWGNISMAGSLFSKSEYLIQDIKDCKTCGCE